MSTLYLLPATAYRPPSPGQVHRRRKSLNLNTILEESDSESGSFIEVRRGRDVSPDMANKMANWLSPLSDHFPTPRGNHFMSAPIPQSDDSSDAASISPSPSSAPWTRDSYTTEATEFDDLYDVSSDEETRRRKTYVRRNSARQATKSNRSSTDSSNTRSSRSSLPALVIPSSQPDPWAGVAAFKLLTSPVPPTPPPKVPMSPAIFSYLQSQEVPSCSAPPSLDGSLNSDQMAQMSAPPTPDLGHGSEADGNEWGMGVQLQPAAMATLQALSGGDYIFEHQTEQVIELTHITPEVSPAREMQQSLPPLITSIHRNDSIILSPEQQRSMNSLTRLEIPSPGGFFSALSSGARHTWHLVAYTPESAHPPSSTTAEHFYKTPWNSAPVERIVEVSENSETMSDGLPTARPSLAQLNLNLTNRPELKHEDSDEAITGMNIFSPLDEEIVADEIIADFAAGYVEKLTNVAVANLDRTGMWLNAQSSYLSELINPTEEHDDEVTLLKRAASTKSQSQIESQIEFSPARKTVRFSEIVSTSTDVACPLPTIIRQESAYYRAFQHFVARSRYRDTFIHRLPRFEALQAQRISFPDAHRAQLLGKYQLSVVPMSAKRRLSANVARGDEIAPEDPEKLKRYREYEASTQMAAANWNVMAAKLLNGGRLIAAPVAKRLARLSSMGPKMDGTPRDRARILDLGGQATCDWAWHCATEYPNTKVYTITTKSLRQLSNSNIRGPKNHRNVAVDRLVKLPFQDNQFDLISAREIYTILREQAPNGQDEWDACLTECMRVLKPGGYLEFSIMDSDIVNAGPLGLARSVEFGFNLKTLGYDPTPTKLFISRLNAAGFVNVRRAWVFLPMGVAPKKDNDLSVMRGSMGVEVDLELEAMVSGSTDNAASITGIVVGWAWEKWVQRCAVQTGAAGGKAESVAEILEEGRACGGGWRTVSGWARKPL
ncbi:related to verprolin [Rhynchosporium agropyri]|uniref:Related to verprolin n=1 Tax=Rhynchosporium agropyri TaxID=914238 RepID=A0A1E1JY10_9HELO|nr:related to verprolin [Rhynchosporium agropyri]